MLSVCAAVHWPNHLHGRLMGGSTAFDVSPLSGSMQQRVRRQPVADCTERVPMQMEKARVGRGQLHCTMSGVEMRWGMVARCCWWCASATQ